MLFAVNEIVWMNTPRFVRSNILTQVDSRILDQEQSPVDVANLCSTSPVCTEPIIRQFWKAGVYNHELTPKTTRCITRSYLINI